MTVIHKTASTEVDPRTLEYVMSDGSVDRMGDIIEPRGWKLDAFKRNPIALFGHSGGFPVGQWKDIRVEDGKLKGRLEFAKEGTSPRIDEIRSLAEQGILKAVSVGFHPVPGQVEPLEKGRGLRYKQAELVECSVVSVPANPNALQIAKGLGVSDDTLEMVFGKSAVETVRRDIHGKSAATSPNNRTSPMSLSQTIEAVERDIIALRDQLTEHVTKSNGDFDDDGLALSDTLNAEIERKVKTRDSLKATERSLALKADAVQPELNAPSVSRKPAFAQQAKNHKPGDLLIRSAVVAALTKATQQSVGDVLRTRYPNDEAIPMVLRAAVAPATTTTSGWAAELVGTAVAEFLETLRAVAVYPRLAGAGVKIAFGPGQGIITIPSRAASPSIGGSFVGQGSAIPVRRLGLSSISLSPHKVGVITTFTREIAEMSTPGIEGFLRQEIEADTAAAIDALLIDATAGSTTRPAGLLNGVTGITPDATGDYTSVQADFLALLGAFYTAKAGRNLVLLINPVTMLSLMSVVGGNGESGFAQMYLDRFAQVVESTAITAGTLIAVDAADFVSATGDNPDFRVSDQVTVHEEDTTPAALSAAGTPNTVAAPIRSTFQTDTLALRMILPMTWAMRRSGMVQSISGVSWD